MLGGLCWGSMLGSLHWEGLCSGKSALGCLCWGSSVGYLHWRAYPGWVGPRGICPGGVCPGGPVLGTLHCVCTCTKPAPKGQCLLGAAAMRPLTGCQAPAAQALGLGSHLYSNTSRRSGSVPAAPGPLPKRSQPPCCVCPKSQPPAHRNCAASTCWHALPGPCCMLTFPLLLARFPHPPSPQDDPDWGSWPCGHLLWNVLTPLFHPHTPGLGPRGGCLGALPWCPPARPLQSLSTLHFWRSRGPTRAGAAGPAGDVWGMGLPCAVLCRLPRTHVALWMRKENAFRRGLRICQLCGSEQRVLSLGFRFINCKTE